MTNSFVGKYDRSGVVKFCGDYADELRGNGNKYFNVSKFDLLNSLPINLSIFHLSDTVR